MVYNASLMTLFSSRQVLSPGDSHFGLESPNDNETLSPLMEVCLGLGGLCSNPKLNITLPVRNIIFQKGREYIFMNFFLLIFYIIIVSFQMSHKIGFFNSFLRNNIVGLGFERFLFKINCNKSDLGPCSNN